MTVLLAALLVRALVPEGFMPAQGEMVELCTQHGLRMVLLDPSTGDPPGEPAQDAQAACPWSLLLTPLASNALPPAAPARLTTGSEAPEPVARHATLPRVILPPARAPPALLQPS